MPPGALPHDGVDLAVSDHGPADAPVVVALHGFPADRHCWDGVATRLAAAGLRTLAPDQRGYGPGPAPAGRRAYRLDRLGADVLALADRAGVGRFHLVGHDWGATVAWWLAAEAPERVATLTAVSVPHPAAFAAAVAHGTQALRSWYMAAFQVPRLPEALLGAGGGTRFAATLRRSGLDDAAAQRYAGRAGAGAMTGPLNWYRALSTRPPVAVGRVTVPTLMLWAPDDAFVTRRAATGSAARVDASYRFVEIPGGSHWLPERAPDAVASALLAHIADHPDRPGGG